MLGSPKRKLRDTVFLLQEPHSLGSRLGLPGVPFRSADSQSHKSGGGLARNAITGLLVWMAKLNVEQGGMGDAASGFWRLLAFP
jgi:hypothetical protein